MENLEGRFERNVDRTGDHHLWTGARDAVRGTGRVKVRGKNFTAHRVAWELANGPLPTSKRVIACNNQPACVRLDHLRVQDVTLSATAGNRRGRGRKGAGSMRQIRPGVWKLTVTAPAGDDGVTRRANRTVYVRSAREAADELASFAAEIKDSGPRRDDARSVCVDDAIEQFITEHLRDEKGREDETLRGYRTIHRRWFSPEIGQRLVRSVDAATIDRIFGKMRRAGLSRSTLNQAKSLYGPFFRWAKRRRLITRNPMAEFELPTSKNVSRERTPPEAWELSILLNEAVLVAPEVAPLLVLGAVTGMRRGELVGLRRSRINWAGGRISVDAAITGKRLKPTKTRKERTLHVDQSTLAMLRRHCDEVDRRAQELGAAVVIDPFVFTLSPDGSEPIPPHYVTKRVAVIKERLGIEDKEPQTIAREDEALRLFRQERPLARSGKRGPHSKGGLTFSEIGDRLGRSERWAALAVAAAERREQSGSRGLKLAFDGSILALRKFTSSELLDAGFNLSMVAQRQGHGPQVLTKHYARSRASADRRAAEHLGRVVHGPHDHQQR